EAALRAEPYGVLHIASHASFGASADDAYVVTWDGRLGARQLADLVELTRFRDRPLELLTLSACDTSVGDERAALGLAGLAVRAGARSTLGTLWPVDDQAAAELVGRFYRELARPGGSRAEALRRAQRAVLAEPQLAHPAYWSPFVMIGSWQ
ncbi:MAG TPA: CHAT domain-containing protein, partial [Myxococcota bacterium]|nr:CHAT domain-containing protein [Myxococcota bacterium]